MKIVKTILRWIVNVLTAILFIILAIAIYGRIDMLNSHNSYPVYFGYTVFQVASGSMEPTLYIDDVIIVNTKDKDVKVDDIIAYQSGDSIITHRVVFIDGDTITVKGDNNNTIDTPINQSAIIGKVVKILPKLKMWKSILTEPKILVAIFITLILFDFALSYQSPKKEASIRKEKLKKELAEAKEEPKEEKDPEIHVEQIKPSKKDIIESDQLLELTRQIDLSEINNLLDSNSDVKMNPDEVNALQDKIDLANKEAKKNKQPMELPKLKAKEKDFLEYTMRLDLKQIQQEINKKIK